MNWVATASETWVDISPSSGVLNPGDSVIVTVSFNAEAEALPPAADPYVAELRFSNATNGCGSVVYDIELNVGGESWLPYVIQDFGESGINVIEKDGIYEWTPDTLSTAPGFYIHVFNEDFPPFPGPGDPFIPSPGDDLTISNIVSTCPEWNFYVGEITVPGPSEFEGAPCRFQVIPDPEPPSGVFHITISFDWTCGSQSGTFEFMMIYNVAAPLVNAPWSWGSNFYGELGVGNDFDDKFVPTPMNSPALSVNIESGDGVSVVLRDDGTLWSTGTGFHGANGQGSTSDITNLAQIGTDSDWLKLAYSSTAINGAAIKLDGTLWTWGDNQFGQIGDGTTTNRLSPVQVGSDADWNFVAVGGSHMMAIKTDGTLWTWGRGGNGQLGLGGTSNFNTPQQVGGDTDWARGAGGSLNTFAIKTNGTLWATGANSNGTLGIGNTFQQNSFVQVGTDSDWLFVSSGTSSAAAIKTSGGGRTLWSWGRNNLGQLGLGDNTDRNVPVQVGSATWVQVCCSNLYMLARQLNGTIWGTGWNGNTQLAQGDGDYDDRNVMSQIGTASNWIDISAGRSHGTAISPA